MPLPLRNPTLKKPSQTAPVHARVKPHSARLLPVRVFSGGLSVARLDPARTAVGVGGGCRGGLGTGSGDIC